MYSYYDNLVLTICESSKHANLQKQFAVSFVKDSSLRPSPQILHTMTNKLHYYPATGRANMIRLALSAANIPFEDVYPTGGFPVSVMYKVNTRYAQK